MIAGVVITFVHFTREENPNHKIQDPPPEIGGKA